MIFGDGTNASSRDLLGSLVVCIRQIYRIKNVKKLRKSIVNVFLNSEEPEIHQICFDLLVDIGDEWAAGKVLHLPPHKTCPASDVLSLLYQIGPPALDPLKSCIESEGYVKKALALKALIGIGGDEVFEYVFNLFKTTMDPFVWDECVLEFRWFRPDVAVPALLYALDKPLEGTHLFFVIESLAVIPDEYVVKSSTRFFFDDLRLLVEKYTIVGDKNALLEQYSSHLQHSKKNEASFYKYI